jgi:hypothetical protein
MMGCREEGGLKEVLLKQEIRASKDLTSLETILHISRRREI